MKLETVMICDDIRQELGGKQSLMGLYNDIILFEPVPAGAQAWPKLMKLAFFIRLTLDEKESIPPGASFSFSYSRGDESVEILRSPILMKTSAPSRVVNLSIVANPFIIKGPGEMSFSLQLYNADGKTIKAFPQAGVIRMEQR